MMFLILKHHNPNIQISYMLKAHQALYKLLKLDGGFHDLTPLHFHLEVFCCWMILHAKPCYAIDTICIVHQPFWRLQFVIVVLVWIENIWHSKTLAYMHVWLFTWGSSMQSTIAYWCLLYELYHCHYGPSHYEMICTLLWSFAFLTCHNLTVTNSDEEVVVVYFAHTIVCCIYLCCYACTIILKL